MSPGTPSFRAELRAGHQAASASRPGRRSRRTAAARDSATCACVREAIASASAASRPCRSARAAAAPRGSCGWSVLFEARAVDRRFEVGDEAHGIMISRMLGLASTTDPAWARSRVVKDETALLRDHAHLERKAAGHVITLMGQVPGAATELLEVAREELEHYERVCALLEQARQVARPRPGQPVRQAPREGDQRDPAGSRVLRMGLIEARSYERFCLLADSASGELGKLFADLKDSEAGHHALFIKLAYERWPRDEVKQRWKELTEAEAEDRSVDGVGSADPLKKKGRATIATLFRVTPPVRLYGYGRKRTPLTEVLHWVLMAEPALRFTKADFDLLAGGVSRRADRRAAPQDAVSRRAPSGDRQASSGLALVATVGGHGTGAVRADRLSSSTTYNVLGPGPGRVRHHQHLRHPAAKEHRPRSRWLSRSCLHRPQVGIASRSRRLYLDSGVYGGLARRWRRNAGSTSGPSEGRHSVSRATHTACSRTALPSFAIALAESVSSLARLRQDHAARSPRSRRRGRRGSRSRSVRARRAPLTPRTPLARVQAAPAHVRNQPRRAVPTGLHVHLDQRGGGLDQGLVKTRARLRRRLPSTASSQTSCASQR